MITTKKLRKLATITLTCEPEDLQIRGNAMCSGDDATDREAEQWIIDQIESGNDRAWCYVTVTATYAGISASDHLGACSYMCEADFRKPGDYYDDMVSEALRLLESKLRATQSALNAL